MTTRRPGNWLTHHGWLVHAGVGQLRLRSLLLTIHLVLLDLRILIVVDEVLRVDLRVLSNHVMT